MTKRVNPLHTKEFFHAVLRTDFYAFMQKAFGTVLPEDEFIDGPHLEYLCDCLERAYLGKIKRLIITVPPRSLKSFIASVAFPAWVLGKNPSHRLIAASYSVDLARKFARDSRLIIECEWYREVFIIWTS